MKRQDLIESIRRSSTHFADQDFVEDGPFGIEGIMKEYAEWYAVQCMSRLLNRPVEILNGKIRYKSLTDNFEFTTDSPEHE